MGRNRAEWGRAHPQLPPIIRLEACGGEEGRRVTIPVAAVAEAGRERSRDTLHGALECSGRGGDVVDEDDTAAGDEHAAHLGEGDSRITDRTEHEGADDGIHRIVRQGYLLAARVERHRGVAPLPGAGGEFAAARRIGFEADPEHIRVQGAEVHSLTGTDLEDAAAQP